MTCESCGGDMVSGFPAVRQQGSTFNVDFMPGELEVGWFGAKRVHGRAHRPIRAWACESCGRVVFQVDPVPRA